MSSEPLPTTLISFSVDPKTEDSVWLPEWEIIIELTPITSSAYSFAPSASGLIEMIGTRAPPSPDSKSNFKVCGTTLFPLAYITNSLTLNGMPTSSTSSSIPLLGGSISSTTSTLFISDTSPLNHASPKSALLRSNSPSDAVYHSSRFTRSVSTIPSLLDPQPDKATAAIRYSKFVRCARPSL